MLLIKYLKAINVEGFKNLQRFDNLLFNFSLQTLL